MKGVELLWCLLLIVGCQAAPEQDYRPTAKDTIYRPLTPLPRHKVHEPPKQPEPPQPTQPTEVKQYFTYNTTNNTTNNYWGQVHQSPPVKIEGPARLNISKAEVTEQPEVAVATKQPSYLTYRPRSVYPKKRVEYKPRNDGYRGYREVYHRPYVRSHRVCDHVRVPINERRWREPLCRQVFQGYDICGLPIYRDEILRHGEFYYITVGYKCRRCGCRL